jgi:hypothetical protein
MKLFGRSLGPDRDTEVEDEETLDDGPEGEAGEAGDDELADFDDEAREHVTTLKAQWQQQAREEAVAAARQQAQARGFDFGQDGSLLLADPTKLHGWLPAATPAAPNPLPVPEPPAALDLTNVPDPTLYPEDYRRWLNAYVAQEITTATQGHVQQARKTTEIVQQMAAQSATQRAVNKLTELGWGHLAQHPQFVNKFTEALFNVDMGYWQDDTSLARIALSVAPDLGPMQPPAPSRRPKATAADPAAVAQNLASQAGAFVPSRPGGAPTPEVASDVDRAYAKALGFTVAQVKALKDPTGESYSALKEKERKARR